MHRSQLMKCVKTICMVFFSVAFIALIIELKWRASSNVVEKEEARSGGDYFNGEIVEVSEKYIVIKPTAEWTWDEASRVVIPVTPLGENKPENVQASLFDGDLSELKPGDMVRVAFNAQTMYWAEDEVRIGVVFKMFRWTDDEAS